MRTQAIRRLGTALLAFGLISCAPGGAAPSTAPVASPGTTATASPGPSIARTLTMADNGRSVTLAVGDRFLLQLGTGYDWTVVPLDSRVVVPLPDGATTPGVQGAFEAVGVGTVTLSATGDPPCRKASPPCAAPSILFEVTLVVG